MDHYTILIQYRPVWSIWYRQRERTSVTCGRRQISSIILTLKKQKQHSRLLKIRYWFCCVYMILIRKVSRSGLEKLPVFCVFFCLFFCVCVKPVICELDSACTNCRIQEVPGLPNSNIWKSRLSNCFSHFQTFNLHILKLSFME